MRKIHSKFLLVYEQENLLEVREWNNEKPDICGVLIKTRNFLQTYPMSWEIYAQDGFSVDIAKRAKSTQFCFLAFVGKFKFWNEKIHVLAVMN